MAPAHVWGPMNSSNDDKPCCSHHSDPPTQLLIETFNIPKLDLEIDSI